MVEGEQGAGSLSGRAEPSAGAAERRGRAEFHASPHGDVRHPLVRRLMGRDGGLADNAGLALDAVPMPLVEPGIATFLWYGSADAVHLRHFMDGPTEAFPFERLGHSDLWHLRLEVPNVARFEYKLDISRDGHSEWITDPRNPDHATDPFGANSVCHTFGYTPPSWSERAADTPEGRLERIMVRSEAFQGQREAAMFLPAGLTPDTAMALVVVHDGYDYVEHAALAPMLDSLVHHGDLPPLAAVLTQSPDRSVEYVDDSRHAHFIAHELLPAAHAHLGIETAPERRVLMGASLGAVAALSVAARHTGAFAGIVLKSGSFIVETSALEGRGEVFERVWAFVRGLDRGRRLAEYAFVTCGRYEGLIGENRRMAAFLHKTGVRTRFLESRDAHHWQNWRDQVRAGLLWCLRREEGRTDHVGR